MPTIEQRVIRGDALEHVFKGGGRGFRQIGKKLKLRPDAGRREGLALSADEKYSAIAEKLQGNRFRVLLEKHQDPEFIKARIREWLWKSRAEYGPAVLEDAFRFVESFYTDEKTGRPLLRKDGKTPKVCHPLSVALGIAQLGGDFGHVLTALCHDLLEDSQGWSGEEKAKVLAFLRGLGGGVLEKVQVLTHDKGKGSRETYDDYLGRVYSSNDMFIMAIKALDTLENLKTLYVDGFSDEFKQSTIEKAIKHVKLWRKINRQFFELMLELIKGVGLDGLEEKVKHDLEAPSLAQIAMESAGCTFVNWRGEIAYSLILSLPNADSPVLIIYKPEAMQEINYIEVEFPECVGGTEEAARYLRRHLGWMAFEEEQSRLPENLRNTAIFRTRIVPPEERERFVDGIERIGREIGGQYRKEQGFFDSLRKG
ncbi:MAG: hypothetical protein WC717_02660 [Candidatus Micrarchaeia archaeon]